MPLDEQRSVDEERPVHEERPVDEQLLTDARAAYDRSDWPAAFAAFRAADAVAPLAVGDLERAGLAAVWVGEADAGIDFRQRAFAMHLANGDERRAAGAAINLCFDHANRHHEAVALGWGQQAERLLEGSQPCAPLGHVAPDIGWSAGLGPEVRGPGEAILMALNGRGAALGDLTGEGTAVLASRIEA